MKEHMSEQTPIIDDEDMQAMEEHEDEFESDMAATEKSTGDKMEFHVQMRGYTQRDMEALVVEAAARMLVGHRNETQLSRQIEARCIELIQETADKKLASVTAEIMDQPITPRFASSKQEPVTMREFIGLTGREYLAERVGGDGKVTSDGWARTTTTRLQWIVEDAVRRDFKRDIEKATSTAISEVQKEIKDQHAALIDAEKKRFREAIDKITA